MIRGWVSPACTAPRVGPADHSSAGEEESLLFASLDIGVAEGAVEVTFFWDGAEEC